eukprot:3293920-Pyramimonas_sp.AAC.1
MQTDRPGGPRGATSNCHFMSCTTLFPLPPLNSGKSFGRTILPSLPSLFLLEHAEWLFQLQPCKARVTTFVTFTVITGRRGHPSLPLRQAPGCLRESGLSL